MKKNRNKKYYFLYIYIYKTFMNVSLIFMNYINICEILKNITK